MNRYEYTYAQVHYTEETEAGKATEEKRTLPGGVPEPPEVKWTEVKAANQDIIAWITVSSTGII